MRKILILAENGTTTTVNTGIKDTPETITGKVTVDDVKDILRTAIFKPHTTGKNSIVDKLKNLLGGEKK